MKAPQRLVDKNALFGKLVDADNRQEPRADVLEDLLRKLPAPETASAAPARAPSRLRKWIPLAVLGGCILTSVAIFERSRTSQPPVEAAPSMPVASAPVAVPPARSEAPVPDERTIPTVSIDDLPSSRPKAPAPSGRREIELIIAAREALTKQEPDRCLASVSAYESEYPGGQFALEAKVMRVEATVARGDRPRARALARDFLVKNPSSLYDERVRSILASLEER